MIAQGAASIPAPSGRADRGEPPGMDELRVALRPPELPVPTPRDPLTAAHRVMDLQHAERYREALDLADRFAARPADPQHRLALLRARLGCALTLGDRERQEAAASDLITHLRRQGHRAQASATATVLLETGPAWRHDPRPAGRTAVDAPTASTTTGPSAGTQPVGTTGPSARTQPVGTTGTSRGRRRGERTEVTPALLTVVRALARPALATGGEATSDRRRSPGDPRREARLLREALEALPEAAEQLLGDPAPGLLVRLAQLLEAGGDPAAATTCALDALERIEQVAAETGPLPDPDRVETAAHALLARTLAEAHPLLAARHGVDALLMLREVDDPPLRVGLITDLLHALMRANLPSHASFTAGRLISLQRTLGRDVLRTAPLLAVAAQRISAERYEAAQVPLEQARLIARRERDRRASLEAARLAASIHERTGDDRAALVELRAVAADARWLVDDLATSDAERSVHLRTELQAQALILRRSLDRGETASACAAAAAIERRTRPDAGRWMLPAELLWDHRVDALVGRFIAIGDALARAEDGIAEEDYDRALRDALEAIGAMPPGHDARARYWAAYLDERHAALLAGRGLSGQAQKAAKRAHAGWQALEADDDAERAAGLLQDLDAGE